MPAAWGLFSGGCLGAADAHKTVACFFYLMPLLWLFFVPFSYREIKKTGSFAGPDSLVILADREHCFAKLFLWGNFRFYL